MPRLACPIWRLGSTHLFTSSISSLKFLIFYRHAQFGSISFLTSEKKGFWPRYLNMAGTPDQYWHRLFLNKRLKPTTFLTPPWQVIQFCSGSVLYPHYNSTSSVRSFKNVQTKFIKIMITDEILKGQMILSFHAIIFKCLSIINCF